MAHPLFKLRRPTRLSLSLSPTITTEDEVLILACYPPSLTIDCRSFYLIRKGARWRVHPVWVALDMDTTHSFTWFSYSNPNERLIPDPTIMLEYRGSSRLEMRILRVGSLKPTDHTEILPRAYHPISYPMDKTYDQTLIKGILKMSQSSFSVKTFDDLMSMRALTGVTRITEHHLLNHKTTRCYAHQWLVNGVRLSDVEKIVDYLESAGFFVELRHDDPLGPPPDQSATSNNNAALNAYLIDDAGLVRSLINVNISDHLVVTAYQIRGEPNRLEDIRDLLTHCLVDKPIKLRYLSGFALDGKPVIEVREISKHHNRPLDCFYPHIEEGINALTASYLESKNNLLFMISEPGTGKSTLIREMCRISKGRPLYQFAGDKVIGHPSFDLFLASLPNNAICIMEDAENLVAKRTEGNTTMALLLNEIDGIANKNIKFIISTNFENRKHVDEALFRPGRCFRTLEFGKLTREQGQRICDEMQIDRQEFLENNAKFTLAELLADGGDTKQKSSGPGFNLT